MYARPGPGTHFVMPSLLELEWFPVYQKAPESYRTVCEITSPTISRAIARKPTNLPWVGEKWGYLSEDELCTFPTKTVEELSKTVEKLSDMFQNLPICHSGVSVGVPGSPCCFWQRFWSPSATEFVVLTLPESLWWGYRHLIYMGPTMKIYIYIYIYRNICLCV